MLTLAVVLLFLAIFAGIFGTMIAGPVGPILTIALLLGFVAALGLFLRDRHNGPRRPGEP